MKSLSVFLSFLVVSLMFVALPKVALADLQVENVRVGVHADKIRLVIETNEPTNYRAFTLTDPNRIVVDLPHFNWQVGSKITPSKGSAIQAVRHGKMDGTISRMVFDMDSPVALKSVFKLPQTAHQKNRLVLDYHKGIAGPKDQKFGSLTENTTQQASLSTPTKIEPVAPTQSNRIPIIVIDPGHGGPDPGAVSGKTYEKDLVLALSKQLKVSLESKGKFKVYLTRDNDRYIKLHERVKFARRKNADLFVSVHADSIRNKNIRGASVYTLSEKASDAQTARLAARENKSDLIAGVDLTHEDTDVANILLDLAQRDTMNQSNYFAEKLVKSFQNEGIQVLENPHRSAGFAVLKAPDIPSILIEAGFVSNRHDAKLLKQTSHQKRLARTIANGIDQYLTYVQTSQKM